MSESISINDFPPHIRERLEQAVRDAETITLTDKNRPVAEVRPLLIRRHTPESLAKLFESLPHLTPEEAEAFGRDIEESRRLLNQIPMRDPWQD
jgi:antitoxin (DNA-binding transcriptional repressor) of toxin-antitoxin stability system